MKRKQHLFYALMMAAALVSMPAYAVTLPAPVVEMPLASQKGEQKIVLAGGCFWGIEEVFQSVKGVTNAVSGYAGGTAESAKYDIVSLGQTKHAEAVEVTFDPSQVTLGQLLNVFFSVAHDPTQLNRQGPDTGAQYRSAVFTTNADQEKIVKAYIAQLDEAKVFAAPLVTEVSSLEKFYPAEAYHQDYARLHPDNPYIVINDLPKVAALKKEFPALYRE